MMNWHGRGGLLRAFFVCAVVLSAGRIAMGQPANDNCANAITIGDGIHSFSTVGATTDGPAHAGVCQFSGQTYADIWYQYQATCTGPLTISTCGTVNYDSDLVIYDGCNCAAPVLAACNDDTSGCSNFSSEVTAQVVEGNCYLIRVGGYGSIGDVGSGTFLVQCGGPQPIGGALTLECLLLLSVPFNIRL